MLDLTIESRNLGDNVLIESAYKKALETTKIKAFFTVLSDELPTYKVGRGGTHFWIVKDGVRVAIIANVPEI